MRVFLFLLAIAVSIQSSGQLEYGYNKDEARDMISLCNSFSFIEMFNSDAEILPKGYVKVYTSGVFGMDNRYEIFEKGDIAVIAFRGTIGKRLSVLENANSAMIPAQGVIKIAGEDFSYCFAKDTAAYVHSGYALGMAYLSKDLIYHINVLNNKGINNIIITGHSQGGAIANLLRAYLENLSNYEISKNNRFKTYAFAAPMVGNKAFAAEYNARFCANNSSFNIIIPSDPMPNLPVSYDDGNYMKDNLYTLINANDSFSARRVLNDIFFNTVGKRLNNSAKKMSNTITQFISKDLGTVELPLSNREINYFRLGNRIEIIPMAYPKILRDSSILKNDSLMAIYKVGADGYFLNQELYKKEPFAFQHQPYNYYVSFLKTFFPNQYAVLKKKYLPENLK
jgi:hypothetical protein